VEGVFQPRDEVYTVIDLRHIWARSILKIPRRIFTSFTQFNNMKVAFHVHGVESSIGFPGSRLKSRTTSSTAERTGFVTASSRWTGRSARSGFIEKIAYDISPRTGIKMEEVEQLGERTESDRPILIAEDSMLLRKC
jgi:two-component system chemotaxis response regulator CheV